MAGLASLGLPVKESKVTESLDNLVITIFGYNGSGKSVQASKFEKPLFFAFGRSGLNGLPGVKFISVKSWSDWKSYVKQFTDPANYDDLKEDVQTVVLDEVEILFKYCENYVASIHGATSIKEGNNGYGLWRELSDEFTKEILKIFGSGFTVVTILHADYGEDGKALPRGDKRMLEVIMNHSDIIAYAKNNGLSADGVPIHSSLYLADSKDAFSRTRNEYVGKLSPVLEEFTASALIKAYRKGIQAQAEAEGIETITKEEQDAMYEVDRIPFEELMSKASELANKISETCGGEKVVDTIENVLGKGKKLSACTEKQWEAVAAIVSDMEDLLKTT